MLEPPETQNPPGVDAPEGSKAQSGEDQLGHKNTTRTADDYSRQRYGLHGQIRRHLIAAAAISNPGKHPGNVYRTAACTWVRVADLAMVKPAQRESYHYKGLATCGSVWVCPLCASKIQERRRQEVAAAVAYMQSLSKGAAMASFTFPHRVDQPLALLLRLQREALAYMRGWRRYISLMLKVGNVGRIRALEVTHGQNGWHPHTHELLFLDADVPTCWLRNQLAHLWLHACRKVGLFIEGRDNEADFLRHSVDVTAADRAVGEYLAKLDQASGWDVTHELTKSSSKQGKRTGAHPFRLATENTTSALFLEYVEAMKGAQQLVWSRGLKAAVGVSEKTDAELAAEEVTKVDHRIEVTPSAWRVVLGNDARWELTNAAKLGGEPAVREFLQLLGWNDGNDDDGQAQDKRQGAGDQLQRPGIAPCPAG